MKATSNLDAVVDDYIRDHQHDAEREHRWFAIQPDLRKAIEVAALAKSPSGKRLSHQRRIPARVLAESKRCLLSTLDEVQAASSFEELHDRVGDAIGAIRGIGELAVYDTALRIGAFLELEPEEIFLHAGTRSGAQALGLDTSCKSLAVSAMPEAFRRLKPSEIEDVLCIYKHRFVRKRPK